MADVNYVEYAFNGLRLVDVGDDATTFLSQNGSELGALIGVLIAVFLLVGITIFVCAIIYKYLWKRGK